MAKQQMNLIEIEAMNSLQELDNVLGAGGGAIQTIVLSNQFYSDKTMVIVSHQLDIVNYVILLFLLIRVVEMLSKILMII